MQSKVSDEEDVSEKEHKEKEDSQREKEESDRWCYFSWLIVSTDGEVALCFSTFHKVAMQSVQSKEFLYFFAGA